MKYLTIFAVLVLPAPWLAADNFFAFLQERPAVTVGEVEQVVSLLLPARGKDAATLPPSPAEARKLLATQGWKVSTASPGDPATAGYAALLFFQALGLRGGLTTLILGPTERYSVMELSSRRLMAHRGECGALSGRDLVSLLGRASAWRQEREGSKP